MLLSGLDSPHICADTLRATLTILAIGYYISTVLAGIRSLILYTLEGLLQGAEGSC